MDSLSRGGPHLPRLLSLSSATPTTEALITKNKITPDAGATLATRYASPATTPAFAISQPSLAPCEECFTLDSLRQVRLTLPAHANATNTQSITGERGGPESAKPPPMLSLSVILRRKRERASSMTGSDCSPYQRWRFCPSIDTLRPAASADHRTAAPAKVAWHGGARAWDHDHELRPPGLRDGLQVTARPRYVRYALTGCSYASRRASHSIFFI